MREFFREFGPLVNRLVWRLLGADRDHDDVVQQSFLNLFEAAGGVREARALPAWVACVTVNTVRRELRRRKLLRLFFPPAAPPPAPAVPGADAERRMFLERCYVFLERMSTEDRIVFSLRFIEGYTLEEVAQLCGCSLATAKRRLARARQKFSELAARDSLLGAMLEGGGS
ncbi:MAG: sigma-70 family RNA polymerase sigma factor [Myxococcales bacterium]|nr:sigma-70 family RNA polymerase sigma factor [Myxococcales bacterium]